MRLRFHVKYQDRKIFVGFQAKNFRFVFYTHGKIFKVEEWKKFVETFDLRIYDEEENWLTWEEFMLFVDHQQYHSNSKWVNGYTIDIPKGRYNRRWDDVYNFSNNAKKGEPNRL